MTSVWRAHHSAGAFAALHNAVVGQVLRAFLAEDTQVVGKLHGEVAANNAVHCILRISRACRAGKCCILVEDIVYTDHNLAQLIAEEFLTQICVAKHI